MKINWYGQSCFKIQDKDTNILINPYSPRRAGLRGPNFKSTILILTDPQDFEAAKKDASESFLIYGPGEYEIQGIFVYGLDFKRKDKHLTVYQLEIEGIKFGILGEINENLTNEELEYLDGIDVLLIPVGGDGVLTTKKAREIINVIGPKIIIPCCYHIPGIKLELEPIEKILKDLGIKNFEKTEKLSLKQKDLHREGTKTIILEPNIN